ncbi:MAG: polyprenyl synthetase family protein [Gammaproteobacteria bacterium]|nr:polyprenyl synthetase family protein [Gammaproteobacteria bacterium]
MTSDFAPLKAAIERALALRLDQQSALAPSLIDAMRYALLGGGKRLRPLFTLVTAESLGAQIDAAMPAACAIEMIHSYSLVHDDLPAMDNDDLRHGKPSTHKAFAEWTAILAGDALLTLAFETLGDLTVVPSDVRMQCVQILARASGWRGMVGGQTRDMQLSNHNVAITDIEDLKALHAAKTGALIRTSVELGARVAGVSESDVAKVSRFADSIGLAFQIMDDVLDVTASTETLGKPAGSDVRENKQTFVTFLGVDGARREALTVLESAEAALAGVLTDASRLLALGRMAVIRTF